MEKQLDKQKIAKQYSPFLICLAIVSMIVLLVTPFVTAFKIDPKDDGNSETGVGYIFNLLGIEESASSKSWMSELLDTYTISSQSLIEENVEKWIICALTTIIVIYASINFFKAIASFFYKNQYNVIYKMFSCVVVGLVFSIIYYGFCMYIVMKTHDWNFKEAFSPEAFVITKTYVPLIVQVVVFGVAMFFYKHWSLAIAERVSPLKLLFREKDRQAVEAMDAEEYSKEYRNLKDRLDAGIITEEEFNVQKKSIKKYGMIWYKFLVYFALYATFVVNASLAIMYLRGTQYGVPNETIYEVYPVLQIVDIFICMTFAGMAIAALLVRNSLSWSQRKGPKRLCIFCLWNTLISLAYVVLVSLITDQMMFTVPVIVYSSSGIIMAIISYFYFKKRSKLFRY